jgi:cytoskeleton protein RodZ
VEDAADNFVREEEPRPLGAILAAERERQGLSRADVAQRLHMSPSQVEAVEAGDYGRLPKGTFLRGFVRNYAKVLGLDAAPLLEMLAGDAPPAPAPRIVVPTQNIRFDPLGERLSNPYVKAATLAVVAVAIAFAVMYWAMYVRPQPPGASMRRSVLTAMQAAQPQPAPAAPAPRPPAARPEPAAPPSTTPPRETASGAQPAATQVATPAAAVKPAAPAPAKAPTQAATDAPAQPVAAKAPVPGAKRIRFHFVGESWVEVRDAEGKVLFQRLNPAGSDAQLTARPPLEVVVGNAPEVEMTWDGKPFDLASHTEVAVARFTLE